MNKLLKEHFERMASSDMLGHAFLICNSNFDNLKEDLEEILSDYFFTSKIDIENNIDVKIIRPNNDKIVKTDILELQEDFKTFSQFNDNKVYIIDGAEKMNDYAANSLLKFLEEPEKNIYAFLISKNVNRVLPTIKSRCQVLMIENNTLFNISNIEEETIQKYIDFIKVIEFENSNAVSKLSNYFSKREEKENIFNFIEVSMYLYRDLINVFLSRNLEYFKKYESQIKEIMNKNDVRSVINKLIVLNHAESMLQYNLNLNLFMNKLIFDLGGINE